MPRSRACRSSRVGAIVLVATSTISLAACASHSRSAESETLVPQDPGDLQDTEWLLVATGDSDAVPASRSLTLHIGDGTASGNGPCNRYRLSFEVDGDDLTTGQIAATRIACAPRVMSAEERFFRALEKADTIDMESDRLVLSGPDDVRLVFARADDAARDLKGEWHVVNVAAEGALTSVLRNSEPTLDFDSDGELAIDAGCNTGTATWATAGRSLTIDAPRMTLKACQSPTGVMEQEANLVEALSRVATVELANETAVLLDGDGATVLVLTRDEP